MNTYARQNLQNKYLETKVQTASPAQLLIMLVDGAIRFGKMAIQAIEQQNYPQANEYLGRVQDIINEFEITLDRKNEIAANLLMLYEYFRQRLMDANIKKESAPIEEVIGYLQELRTTWLDAAKLAGGMAGAHVSGG